MKNVILNDPKKWQEKYILRISLTFLAISGSESNHLDGKYVVLFRMMRDANVSVRPGQTITMIQSRAELIWVLFAHILPSVYKNIYMSIICLTISPRRLFAIHLPDFALQPLSQLFASNPLSLFFSVVTPVQIQNYSQEEISVQCITI